MNAPGGQASDDDGRPALFSDYSGRAVSEYFRMARWEGPVTPGGDPLFGARVPIDQHERGPAGGIRAGALVSVLDSVGGMMSGLSVLPRWIVTTNLMVRFARLDHVGPLRVGGRVLRTGTASVVSGMVVADEGQGDAIVATAIATMAILEPNDMHLDFVRPVCVPAPDPPEHQVPVDDFFSLEPGDGPTTRLDLVEHLRNPWGILHGGAVAILADEAATRAAAAAVGAMPGSPGGPALLAASDVVIHYTKPNRVGPIEARPTVVGDRGDAVVVRVPIHDVGADDRMTAVATVTVRRLPAAGG
ncbi:MAG: hypothetical protein M0007_01880 [Actinomycetota bacterium]|jgi:acyl-coenzyme A thioesterase PaaI-like protein|nr:hypothetical protein [Actinomycetota bacterium]